MQPTHLAFHSLSRHYEYVGWNIAFAVELACRRDRVHCLGFESYGRIRGALWLAQIRRNRRCELAHHV